MLIRCSTYMPFFFQTVDVDKKNVRPKMLRLLVLTAAPEPPSHEWTLPTDLHRRVCEKYARQHPEAMRRVQEKNDKDDDETILVDEDGFVVHQSETPIVEIARS